jgi:CRP-like cAMP-binding protein
MRTPIAKPGADALAGLELFHGLPATALDAALDRATMRQWARDAVIFRQGEPTTRCHALIDGRVRILQSDEDGAQLLIRFIGPGEMFGAVALFTTGEYPAEATTVTEALEISWRQADLFDLITAHPQIALNIVRVVGARLHEVQERLRELASQRVARRIAHVLLRLAAQAATPGGHDPAAIDFPLTRKDIAEMCGATLHTVSRVLTAWETAGLVSTHRQRIILHDLPGLRRIAEDGLS